ncbi:restriction endonuclease subunit S [Campylobacter concisus]|uniref:restriction endonuclease subunit S n=1 Tax=Campylobacter concisus TaxID=199 RepID=UPI003D1C9DA8
MDNYKTLNFLENKKSFENFYKDAKLTDEDKHRFLITSREILKIYAKKLNKLMHNHNITAPQRVLYVSGMLLSMQDIKENYGLTPDDLKGSQLDNERDGIRITSRISSFLKNRKIPSEKLNLMLASFNEISKNSQRDEIDKTKPNDKEVAHLLKENSSTTKQIFTFLYKNIFQKIDGSGGESFGHIDIMGEMYSEFLKYALGDGKELGIVLTPPYITKMMAEILDINKDNRVMDLATGSAGFLISAMQIMIENANENYAKGSSEALKKIDEIKRNQLLGVELNAEMYTLAATNMILRGDGSARIEHGSAFNRPDELYSNFKADRILLNPPFTFDENGMPFIAYGLDRMAKGGLGAIIIQDSAGSGKAVKSNQQILKSHTLLASIKMPVDLFVPVAGVQTSIYIFKAHEPHDFERSVKFIDFRNDGYKRTSRSLQELDEPTQRYADIVKIYKAGRAAKVDPRLWKLDEIFVEDLITKSGSDWNFDQHKKVDAMPTLTDFKKSVSDYLSWEVSQILKKDSPSRSSIVNKRIANLEQEFKASGGKFEEFRIGDIFDIQTPKRKFDANKIQFGGQYPYVARGDKNNGIRGYINENTQYLNDENTISFGQDTATMFFQKDKYFTGDKIKIFKPINFDLNIRLANYIIASMRRGFSNFAWGSSSFNVEILKDVKILLPTLGGNINFSFMEKFIEELDAYLRTTGLKNYELTDAEKSALAKFDEFDKWGGVAKEFKIGDLFEVVSNPQLNKDSFQFSDDGEYPYFTRTVLNNGITGYVDYLDEKHKIKGNSLAVGMLGMQFFYMEKDFYAGQFTKTIYPNFDNFSKNIAQYFIGWLNKKQKFYQGSLVRDFEKLFKGTNILLPINENGEIDYEFMENFIKAIEKLVIKDVVLWADKKIESTKKVINKA